MTDLDDTVVHVHGPDPLTETLTGRRHVPDQIGLKVWVTHVLVSDLFHHRHWDIVLVILLQGIQELDVSQHLEIKVQVQKLNRKKSLKIYLQNAYRGIFFLF